MWMEEKLKALYRRISPSERVAFLSTFVCGMLAHLYIYTNTIPNFDGISRMYDEQQMTISGRWFLHYASAANWYTQMPMVIGVLAMFFLALSSLWVVRLLRIRSNLLAMVWGTVYAVFPAIADTNAYTYTASAYCIAVCLAVLGVMIAKEKAWGFLPGAICLAFSMGIYQTYVTVAIILCVLYILIEVFNEQNKVKDLLMLSARCLGYLGLGTVLYYGILKLFLKVKGLQLWSYLGMSDVENGYPVERLGTTIAETYSLVWRFFFVGEKGLESPVFLAVNIVLGAVAVFLLVGLLRRLLMRREFIKVVGILALILLLPAAVNFTKVISPYSTPRMIMKFSFVFLYLLPILLLEHWKGRGKLPEGMGSAVCIGLMVLTVYFWQYDNLTYTMLNQAHRATLSFVTNVVSRIESCAGYQNGMTVVIVGGFPSDRYDTDIPVYQYVKQESALSSSVIPLNKHIYYYMNDWLNVPIQEPSEEDFLRIAGTEQFQQMPLYPDDGSVQIIDNCVVVKMQTSFTPKSLFEKEYENRR